MRQASVARRLALLCLLLLGVGAGAALAYRGALAWLGPPPFAAVAESSKLVLDRHGVLLRPFTTPGGLWRLPVRAEDVDPRYLTLLLAYEDRRFYQHDGVDGRAIARAAWQLLRERRPVSGGSTLTMQAARLLDSQPTRSYAAKLGQVLRAWQLEELLSKREIVELYMRLAPYGGNIEGMRAASLAYFGKEPKRLTLAEAALLVALPQSPEQRRPDRNPDAARRARNQVLARAAEAGAISRAEADWAMQQPMPELRRNFPALAAHLAERMAASSAGSIRLTIDARLQEGAEALAARHAAKAGAKISAAILVFDKTSGEVLAHVGSAGYFDQERNGPIDMTVAVRSPGSALKPFIYGLGFEDGLGHPETLIEDRPVRFGGYAPENFDESFHGAVSIRQALQLSLNVPAVKMLHAIGPARLAGRLCQAGFAVEAPRNLAVALGGVGLKLEDLATLYGALANGGSPVPLRHVLEDAPAASRPAVSGQPLLSAVAAWYVTDILRGAPPPVHAKGGGVAFKTGTSYGFRDAWAAGFDGQYVVAAWLGRPDGSSTPGLTGLTAAAPLLFDVFAQLGSERLPFASAPDGAIRPQGQLPPPLLRFREPDAPMAGSLPAGVANPKLSIAFPPDRAELELAEDADGKPAPLAFKAEGGALPYSWLVNGAPIDAPPHRRETFWQPSGKGFLQLSVIDATGQVDRVTIRLR
jgi:penicillin-binding protein 1C